MRAGAAARAGALGLPMALAIIGGMPERFRPLVELYREAGRRAGVRGEGGGAGGLAEETVGLA